MRTSRRAGAADPVRRSGSTGPPVLAERVYRLLLLSYPREFRRRYGEEATRVFGELHRDARSAGSRAVARLWWRSLRSVTVEGVRERVGRIRGEGRRPGLSGTPGGRGGWPTPSDLVRDGRVIIRSLSRRPGFAVAIVALVGLGTGATTTIFSIVDGVLLRPLPYPSSDRLVYLMKQQSSVPLPDFVDLRERSRSFDALGAAWNVSLDLTGEGEAERLGGTQVTEDLFDILGVRAYRGRLFLPEEYGPGAPRVAVLSLGVWLRRWGGDDSLIGRTIVLGGEPTTVVGVLGPEYVPPEALELNRADVYVPLDLTRADAQNRRFFVLEVVARLRQGTTVESARTELETISSQLAREYPEGWRRRDGSPMTMETRALLDVTVGRVSGVLWMCLGAVGLMLVIACANVANLFLARSTARSHEMALRSALGAGRRRIIAQLLTESTLLALAGGVAGIALAIAGVAAFEVMDPGGIPRTAEIHVDARVLGFALLLSVLTGILFGLAPAFSSARTQASTTLRESGSALTASRRSTRLRNSLIIAQLALALVLLAGAGLLFNSFIRLRSVDPGFEPRDLLTVQMDVASRVPSQQREEFVNQLERRIAALPGVRSVGASWRLPFDRGRCCWASQLVDAATRADTLEPFIHPVTPGYFRALGASIVAGRGFRESDSDGGRIPGFGDDSPAAPVVPVIVNRVVAEALWPGASPIGRSLVAPSGRVTEYRVIGVAEEIMHWSLGTDRDLNIYVPYSTIAAWDVGMLDIGIRHDGPAEPLVQGIRNAVRSIDADLPIERIVTMDSRISGSIATARFYTALLAGFAGLAFLLAAGGVYGSMLYVVGLRRREMGIRIALGAAGRDVVRLVVARGAVIVATGTLLGLGGALALARVLRSQVFEISATDPLTLTAVSALLAGAGILACWLPARRAARADPVATLRQ